MTVPERGRPQDNGFCIHGNIPATCAACTQEQETTEQEQQAREALVAVAKKLLGTNSEIGPDTEEVQLREHMQEDFQKELIAYFDEAGFGELVEQVRAKSEDGAPLDEQMLHAIAQRSEGKHGWVDMLPQLRRDNPDAGLNCTMGSAMLHIALERLGYQGVRTVLRKGHHVVLREQEDGGLQLYDATSLSTGEDGKLRGYTRTFKPEDIARVTPVQESADRSGYSFVLRSSEPDHPGGFYEQGENGQYVQSFYAYDPSIKMDLAIALENLSEIKDDVHGEGEPTFDMDQYRQALAEYVQQNNDPKLTGEQLKTIARENWQVINELLAAAKKAFDEHAPEPDPFQFLVGDVLNPRADREPLPAPRDFVGSSERYEQAQGLVEKYPELKQLSFKEVKERMGLFDGYDYLGK